MLFMAFFKKKGRVVDLSEKYHSQQEQLNDMRSEIVEEKSQESPPSGNGIFNMFGGMGAITPTTPSEDNGEAVNPEEKKRRLGKRLLDMTNKIEDLTNQIYHLQQRIEVLERKNESRY